MIASPEALTRNRSIRFETRGSRIGSEPSAYQLTDEWTTKLMSTKMRLLFLLN
jgi:hypothetical protein